MKSPFKWVGGKRKLLPLLLKHVPETFGTYFEPFLGGGSLLFALKPAKAFCGDMNDELILTYHALWSEPVLVADLLDSYPNTPEFYYEIRAKDSTTMTAVEVAARFLYLNHAGFNGLYRVNKQGKFNVAFGKRKSLSYDRENFLEISKYLANNEVWLATNNYERILNLIMPGDFVYLDPPYFDTFDSYTSQPFGLAELKTLRENVDKMVADGAKVLISNSNNETVREVFDGFTIIPVEVAWTVGKTGDSRSRKAREILIKTW